MRYLILITIAFFFQLPLFAQSGQNINPDGYNKFYFENGKLSSEGTMRDGKPDGYWKTYNENGKIKSEGNRKNFVLDSVWKFYNEQGKLAFEFNYKDGKKNGYKITYDTKENYPTLAEYYVSDVKQSNSFVFTKDKKVKQTIPFVNGKQEGIGYEFSDDSTIVTITNYKMGFVQREEKINRKDAEGLKQGMWKTFYPNSNVKTEITYSDDKMNGYLKEYAVNGSIINTTKYINGVLQTNAPELAKLDVRTDYYEGGIVKFTGTYKDGVAQGIHREFSPEGKVVAAKIYTDGVLMGEGILDTIGLQQGMWKEYHPNGELKSQGEYVNSKRVGAWKFFHPNGKVEQEGKYDRKGKPQGAWKWYYEDGSVLREENYRNGLQDGIMTEYGENGKVITKGEYIDGLKEGPWFLEMNDYREEGSYKADQRDGEWKHFFTENGKLRYQGKFVDGVPEGMQTFYYLNGKEKQTGKYAGGMKEGEWYFYDESGFLFLSILYKSDIEIRFDGVKVTPETPLTEEPLSK
jgi:antitoxin component YwqK of YwqJK toxin-antitoxin module